MSEYRVEPGQQVVIERFSPEFAEGVTRCFRQVYGDGYPIDTYIDPEKLIEENKSKRVISIIARTVKGDVVGHVSLFSSDPCNLKIYESGSGLVIKEYRNTEKLFFKMVKLSVEIAAEEGIHGMYGEPVCNHPFSQKVTRDLNFVPTAMEIDLMPAAAYQKEASASGRVSVFWAFKTLVSMPHTVFVPEVYREFFDLIYKRIDDKRVIRISDQPIPSAGSSIIRTQIFEFANVLRIAVHEPGPDLEEQIDIIEADAEKKGVVCFQAWLDLGTPCVGRAVEILRQRGYFLGGLLARWFGTDGILMQKLLTTPCWDDVNIAFNQDRAILDKVYTDWQNT